MCFMTIRDLITELRGFPYGIKRSWRFLKVYWGTCDGDWSSIAVVLLHQIREVRKHIEWHNIIADADRVCRQMRIAERCLERMLNEPAYEIADKRYPERGKAWADMILELEKQDVEMLCHQLCNIRSWWD